MKLGILCIGDELLKGSTLNSNLAYMGQKLLENGIVPEFSLEVPDRKGAILEALEFGLGKVDVLITSGGLGPTADDVTREFIAARLGRTLKQHGEAAIAIMRYWNTRHSGEMPPRIMNQSLVPEGATVLLNAHGTAPGLIIETLSAEEFPDKCIILLPGPPNELCPMFDKQALPEILRKRSSILYSKLFYVTGRGESAVEDQMLPLIQKYHPLSVAYCAGTQFVKLFLSSESCETLGRVIHEVRGIFGRELLADGVSSLQEEVLNLLRERSDTLASAESCTGGLLAKLFTDLPGASDVFQGAVVSYSNHIKQSILGVSESTLKRFGAVSKECASEMLCGIAEKFSVTAAVSVTGIAGPGGGTPEKPLGLVYIGVKYRDRTLVTELHLRGSREQIRERSAAKALGLLRGLILESNAEGTEHAEKNIVLPG